MLILTRRIGETLVIGEGGNKAEVMLLGIKGNQVRIGIDASREIPVHRLEVYLRIREENKKNPDSFK